MSVRDADQLGLDLFETQTAFGVRLGLQAAYNLINEAERRKRNNNYEEACRQALDVWGVPEEEREPWKFLLKQVFNRRKQETAHWLNRPFAPPIEDGP